MKTTIHLKKTTISAKMFESHDRKGSAMDIFIKYESVITIPIIGDDGTIKKGSCLAALFLILV